MEDSFKQTRLPNGLTIMLKEIHTAPIISSWVWYRVGSRDELSGRTGISHWVEHMQFKGTEKFPGGILDKAISREGGVWNAFTYLDWTTYYETLPAEKIDLALSLEADRMANSMFDPEEVASERTVIISEREGNENEPLFRLDEAVQAAAFKVHPYGHEVIGDRADLETIQRDDLFNHYRTYYLPNNAVLTIAGDFETDEMLARATEYFGGIPEGDLPPHPAKPEPPRAEEQRLVVHGPGETTFIKCAYQSPAASNPDFSGFTVMDSLLAGPTSLNMFGGGGISNKTSRLYRSLVEQEIAVAIHGGMQATIDPFLYDITITMRPERSPDEAIAVLDDEIKRLQDGSVSADEVARAIKQARAMFAYGTENITNQAFWLGYAEMFSHYGWFINYLDRLATVTPDEVQRIAQTYLQPHQRVIGTYIPGTNGETNS